MSTSPNLNLELLDSSLWQSTYFKDFINALSGTSDTSNMMIIDAAIAALRSEKASLVDGKVPSSQLPDITKEQVGLGNVDNTSDLNKPISAAVQAALDELSIQIGNVGVLLDEVNGEVV